MTLQPKFALLLAVSATIVVVDVAFFRGAALVFQRLIANVTIVVAYGVAYHLFLRRR